MNHTEPLPGSEWSATYEGAPPPSLDSLIKEILELVNSLSSGTSTGKGFPIPDRARVISIFGSRGTGKSTALFFAAHALRESPDYLVLPVIDPEGFALGDSLGGWALAALEKELSESDLGKETGSARGLTLGQDLENLRRAQAVRAAAYLPGLGQRGLSFDDFARDAVKIPSHGVRMADRFASLLDDLAVARSNPSLRLIVPVDDADLFPELLPAIVRDAQMLGASARVIVMFAADPKSLAQALQISYISSHESGASVALREDLIDPQDVRELAGRKLIKYFPRSHRVQLPGMSLQERLAFKPLGDNDNEELAQLLASFPINDGSGRSLADFFVIKTRSGEPFEVSPYTQSLSDNARDLRQLHDALRILAAAHPESASKGLALILEHGLEGLEPDLPPRAQQAVQLDVSRNKERPTVSFDFRGIGFGKSLISGLMIYGRRAESEESEGTPQDHPLSRTVTIRPLNRDYSYLESEAPADEQLRKEEDRPELPDQFTHIALLGWEAMQEGEGAAALLQTTGYFKSITLAGGSNWEGFAAGDNPENEPWRYWVVPRWEEYSDYFTFEAGWNHIINLARSGLDGYSIAEPTLLNVVFLVHHDLVATVHLHRAIPDWIATLTSAGLRELVDAWDQDSAQMKDRVGSHLEEAFVDAEAADAIRDRDFVTWFLSDLPLAGSRLLATEEMSDWLLSVWEKHASADSRRRCASKIIRMAQGHITSYMADGDLQLLERIDPDEKSSAVETLRNIRSEVSERTAQRKADVLRALQEAGVGPDLLASLQAHGVTRELVPALILAGVSPERVTAVAEAFPPTQHAGATTELKQEPTLGPPAHD